MFINKFPEWFELEYRLTGQKPAHLFFGDEKTIVSGYVSIEAINRVPLVAIKFEGLWFVPIWGSEDTGLYLGGRYRLSHREWGIIQAGKRLEFEYGMEYIILN